MSRGVAFLSIGIAGAVAVLQSTVLRFAAITGVQPDLVLIVVIYVAHRNGSMLGQLAGLGAGIIVDLMGLSPLGFHGLVYAVIGAMYGITRGKMFVDPVFMPVLLALIALFVKGLLGVVLGGLYSIPGVVDRIFSVSYLVEMGYSAVLAPVFFGLLKLVGPLHPDRRRGEGL